MIKIEIDDKAVRRALDDLSRRLDDMTPAMHAIGQALAEGSRECILAGRDWTGAAFAPNSAATLAKKRGSRPLIDSKSLVRYRLHYAAGAMRWRWAARRCSRRCCNSAQSVVSSEVVGVSCPGAIYRRGAICR